MPTSKKRGGKKKHRQRVQNRPKGKSAMSAWLEYRNAAMKQQIIENAEKELERMIQERDKNLKEIQQEQNPNLSSDGSIVGKLDDYSPKDK